MIGRRHPYYPYLEAALEAASLARGIHLYYLEKGFTEGTKSGPTDLVTQADREAEEAVKGLLLSRFPEAGFLGEEGGSEGGKALRFIVDPLDGTVNYAHGFPFFAVSIALEAESAIQMGVVMDTARGEVFYALRGEGAYLNGRPTAYEFRAAKPVPEKQPLGEKTPKFITDTLGRHWPLHEGKPASVIRQANPPLSCPPMRLQFTENEHPAARSTRIDVRR